MKNLWCVCVVASVMTAARSAHGADPSDIAPGFAMGIGYAHIEVGGSSSAIHSMDALRFDPCIMFSPLEKVPQLRLGAAFGVSLVLDNSNRTIISSGGAVIVAGSSDVPFLLLEPEVRLSWRQPFGVGFYVEPGLGVGGAIGQLSLDSESVSYEKWSSCFSARAFINVGVAVTGGEAGFQASWMHGSSMDFGDNARGDLNQFYIGIYGALRF